MSIRLIICRRKKSSISPVNKKTELTLPWKTWRADAGHQKLARAEIGGRQVSQSIVSRLNAVDLTDVIGTDKCSQWTVGSKCQRGKRPDISVSHWRWWSKFVILCGRDQRKATAFLWLALYCPSPRAWTQVYMNTFLYFFEGDRAWSIVYQLPNCAKKCRVLSWT